MVRRIHSSNSFRRPMFSISRHSRPDISKILGLPSLRGSFASLGEACAAVPPILMLGNKMKRILIAAFITLGILAVCLLPNASHTIGAYPENLWTSGGQFGEPSKTQALLDWNRTAYGARWAWMVYDSCTNESAWYVRIEPRYLVLYSTVALFGGLVSFVLSGLQKNHA